MISIVIPVYNEGKPLILFCDEIITEIKKIGLPYELVLIDDYSKDDSWQVMKELAASNPNIKVARLIRNFGQHSALTAGLNLCTGDYAVLMDCDGQDDPAYIAEMYNKLTATDAEIVFARRQNRKSSKTSVLSSKLINRVLETLSGIKHDPQIGTYRIMTRKVVDSYISLPETRRYLGGIFFWLGFPSDSVDVIHRSRTHGSSNYNFKRLIRLARLGILSSSTAILSISTYLGIASALISMVFGIYFTINKILYDIPLGFTAIVVSIFFVGSIIMILLGIIGEYIGEIYHEVKARPNYIVHEKINFADERR